MARGLLLLLLAALLCAALVVGWTRPDLLPPDLRAPGLRYEEAYAAWDADMKAQRRDEALAVVDEYLLFGEDLDRYQEDARNMRALALARGAKGPAAASDRDLRWRAERFAARRPPRDWAALVAAFVLGLSGVLAIVRRPRRPAPVEVLGPRPPLA